MKIVVNNDDFIIYKVGKCFDIKSLDKEYLEEEIKKVLLLVKKRLSKSISGFYNVVLYNNIYYGYILEVNKESDLDFFQELIDINLKIVNNAEMYLKFNDYFLINKYNVFKYLDNYYISIKDIKLNDLIKLSDFYDVIYGDKLSFAKSKFKSLSISYD